MASNLYRIFSSSGKAANAKNAIKFAPRKVKPNPSNSNEQTPVEAGQPRNPWVSNGVKDLLNEKDSERLAQKFTSLADSGVFRRRHPKVYEFVVFRLAFAKRFSLIEQILESQKKYICGERFASRFIYLYGKVGMFDHAYKVFDEMPRLKCERGTKSFSTLLTAAVSSKKFDKAYELFRELPQKLSIKPDVDCYNRVMYALGQLGSLNDAVSLLDEMEANGLNPDAVSFNILMGAFYKNGDTVRGDETWERMLKSGLVPDVRCYNLKLLGLVNEGKLTEAIELVEELKSKDLKPDLGTYNALIHGSCKSDDLEGAMKWYDEILKHDWVPNKVTFTTLVPFLCKKGDYGFAFQVCQKFKQQGSVMDEVLLQNVVDGLVKNSMMEEADTLVNLVRSSSSATCNLTMSDV